MIAARLLTLAGFAWWYALVFLVFPRMTPPPAESADLAVAILQNAQQFSSASVGYAGLTPNEVIAWRAIALGPDAESTLVRLLDTATPAGQLYALAGLRFRNEAVFAREAQRFQNRSDQVFTVSGCIGGSASFSEILAQISRGAWVQGFVRGAD